MFSAMRLWTTTFVFIIYFTSIFATKFSEKCDEYAKLKCLQSANSSSKVSENRIVPVESIEEFPHMVILGYGAANDSNWLCSGALITEQYVLAPAHCTVNRHGGRLTRAVLGVLNLDNQTEFNSRQEFDIVQTFRHPDYKRPVRYSDIALLKLDRPAELSKQVLPACLHEEKDIPSELPQHVGWPTTRLLSKVTANVISHEECSNIFEKTRRTLPQGIREEEQFCVEDINNTESSENGFGGILQIRRTKDCMPELIGIASFGAKTDVYTRVSKYVPWIERTIWP